MGTKRGISAAVAAIVRVLPPGPLLDVFAGMGAVGAAVGGARPVWTNDIQPFPALVGRSLFTASKGPPLRNRLEQIMRPLFDRNLLSLEKRFDEALHEETLFLKRPSFAAATRLERHTPYAGRDPYIQKQRQRLAAKPDTFPYRLATITYAGSFFGLRQSMEIDSLRYAIDRASAERRLTASERDWLVIALCQVMSRVNNSTGQFAQYLKPTPANLARVVQKRRRIVWSEFLQTAPSLSPLGHPRWRESNRTFRREGVSLLRRFARQDNRPAIVYADPPYSKAQYSRYYHVLDVMTEYQYPRVAGLGRYPSGRFQTPFALARHVVQSMQDLVEAAAAAEAMLLLSYPTNGLLHAQGVRPGEILRQHYRDVAIVHSSRREHSSFGGRLVAARVPALEHVYLARGSKL